MDLDKSESVGQPHTPLIEPDRKGKTGRQWLRPAQRFADRIDTASRRVLTHIGPLASLPTIRTGLIVAAVLLFDWLTPLGIESGVLYMAAVLSAVPIRHAAAVYLTAAVCSIMVFVGWMISPGPGDTELWKVVVSRSLAMGIIWATAAMADSWNRLQKRRVKQLQESRLLQQATALAASQISFQESLQNSLKSLCDILGWPVGHVYVREQANRLLVPSDVWHLPDDGRFALLRTTAKVARFSIGEGAVGKVWQSGDAIAVTDVAKSPEYDWLSEPERLGVKAAFAFPITVGGNVAAVIECFSDQAVQVDPDTLSLAHSIGQQLGRLFERKRADEALRESEQRLRLALEGGQMGTWFWDLRTDERKWDRREDELLGLDPTNTKERTSHVFFERVHPDDLDELKRVLESSIKNGSSYEHEYRILRPNGELHWLAGKGEVRRDSSGEAVAMFGVNFDITRRKQAEEEIRRAKEAAEIANQLRGQFVANVSHELRTPLNSILGMLQLVLEEDIPATQRDWLTTAKSSADMLLKLVGDLLDFSKLEANQFQIDPQPFSLRDAIDGAIRPFASRAFEKNIELVYDIQPDMPDQLIGDSARLRQVIVNLVGNAIKFTDLGEVILRVELRNRFPHEVNLLFAVSDTGSGISAEDQQRIFEPFTQVDASSTRQYGGVGLGLTISTELVNRMGGTLAVESQLGQGSRFSFSLNLQLQPKASASKSPAATTTEQFCGVSVLVVDDNATSREQLAQLLAHWKMRADVAVDGDHAIGKMHRAGAEGRSYAAIIVDAVMPGMDGIKLANRIAGDSDQSPPVILLVPPGEQRLVRERGEQLTIAAYLEKPVSPACLLNALMTTLDIDSLESAGEQRSNAAAPAKKSLSVLLVEDTPANQKVVTSVLGRRGHEITIAHNGQEAVELWKSHEFDVVLMDVQMPILDGYQATETIRELEKQCGRHTPIIAMTAHATEEARAKCLAAGMDTYIAKPIDIATLVELVESNSNVDTNSGTTVATRDPKLVDLDAALARLGGDRELLAEFVQVFDEDSPGLLKTMYNAVKEHDAESLERAAHSLRGLAANFDSDLVVESAGRMEQLGRSRELAGATALLSELERNLTLLNAALQPLR